MEPYEQEEYKKEISWLNFDLARCKTDAEKIKVLKEHHKNMLIESIAAHNLIDRKDFGWKGYEI